MYPAHAELNVLSSKIDEVLEYLSLDCANHSLFEIASTLKIPLNTCKNIASFLAKYDFAQLQDEGLKITRETRDFIQATSEEITLENTQLR